MLPSSGAYHLLKAGAAKETVNSASSKSGSLGTLRLSSGDGEPAAQKRAWTGEGTARGHNGLGILGEASISCLTRG